MSVSTIRREKLLTRAFESQTTIKLRCGKRRCGHLLDKLVVRDLATEPHVIPSPSFGQIRLQYDRDRDKMHSWCKCGASYDYRSDTVADTFVRTLEGGRMDLLTSEAARGALRASESTTDEQCSGKRQKCCAVT